VQGLAPLWGAETAEQLLRQLWAYGLLEPDLRRPAATVWDAQCEAVPEEVQIPFAGAAVRSGLFDG
jgi:hypothetical protein